MLNLERKVGLLALVSIGSALASCDSSDTIVAVNIALQRELPGLTTLDVTITQAGQAPVTASITPPTVPIDGGTMLKTDFFERVTLPEAWTQAPATIDVVAKGASGATLATADTTTEIEDDGVVAAQITFAAPDAGVSEDTDAGM